eukprot:UN27424
MKVKGCGLAQLRSILRTWIQRFFIFQAPQTYGCYTNGNMKSILVFLDRGMFRLDEQARLWP